MKTDYNESNVPPAEYRVRTVVRHVVTRYCHPYTHRAPSPCDVNQADIPVSGGSKVVCEVPDEQQAWDIANALAESDGATVQRD